jgi:hypothetical protein
MRPLGSGVAAMMRIWTAKAKLPVGVSGALRPSSRRLRAPATKS